MLTNTKQIYSASFISQLCEQGFDLWKDTIDIKSVWGSKEWQVQGTEALFRAWLIPQQIIFLNKTVQQTTSLGIAENKDLNTPRIPSPTHF